MEAKFGEKMDKHLLTSMEIKFFGRTAGYTHFDYKKTFPKYQLSAQFF